MDHQDRGAPLTINESAADASLLIASSLETTSQALTTIFRHLVSAPTIMARLEREVDNAVFDLGVQELDSSILDGMEYLDAVVNEGLRIRPPAPAGDAFPSLGSNWDTDVVCCRTSKEDRTRWRNHP